MSDNKRIAKNTIFLYIRMLLVMGVSLYASRIVLKELGVSDYGVYSLVGGFIAMFRFLDASMASAAQRYLSFALGEKDEKKLAKTFSALLTIAISIAVLVIILAETVGLWYVQSKMVYPSDRTFAVNVVYQLSIVATLIGVIQVPYNALLIAREKMNVYAYVSIAEASLKLGSVFLLIVWGSDKLITYAVLVLVTKVIVQALYQGYCRYYYKESKYRFEKDRAFYRELTSYSGWTLFGSISVIAKREGVNVVLNLFFGTLMNAAYGITNIVVSSMKTFVMNFQVASNPQIIKLYALGYYKDMQKLINQTVKFSFYLTLLPVTIVFINIDYVLELWLIDPPAKTGVFIQISLIFTLIDIMSGPLMKGVAATGEIKFYQLIIGIFNIIVLPVVYLSLKYEIFYQPQSVFWIVLCFSIISFFFRLYFMKRLMGDKYAINVFYREVLSKLIFVTILSILVGYFLNYYLYVNTLLLLIGQALIYCLIMGGIIFFLGMTKAERSAILNLVKKLVNQK